MILAPVEVVRNIKSAVAGRALTSNKVLSKRKSWMTTQLDNPYKCKYNEPIPIWYLEAEMKQCMDSDNLHRRLRKVIGQVQAIDRMVDEDVPCEDILSQINAAKSALHKAGQVVLEGHIKHCVRDGIEHGDADKTVESFTKAVERFANMK